ncbi:MAG: hypothetical protein EXR92_05885 [Gemmatimonadetes bacterium]|nr:hypothetical protein [Gemmatimonadota bacterium]
MTRMRFLLAAALSTVALAGPASAQEEAAALTTRLAIFPSQAVSAGALEFQAGMLLVNTEKGNVLRTGRAILRYGLGPIELRASPPSYVAKWGEEDYRGLDDFTFGVKAPQVQAAGGRVLLGAQGMLSLPTGIEELTADDPALMVSTMADFLITGDLFLSAVVDWHTPYFTRDESWSVTLFPGVLIPAISGGAGLGWTGHADDGSLNSIVTGTLFLLFGEETALDVSAGANLDKREPFVGFRISRLLSG